MDEETLGDALAPGGSLLRRSSARSAWQRRMSTTNELTMDTVES